MAAEIWARAARSISSASIHGLYRRNDRMTWCEEKIMNTSKLFSHFRFTVVLHAVYALILINSEG